jgi:hypothetical protein
MVKCVNLNEYKLLFSNLQVFVQGLLLLLFERRALKQSKIRKIRKFARRSKEKRDTSDSVVRRALNYITRVALRGSLFERRTLAVRQVHARFIRA